MTQYRIWDVPDLLTDDIPLCPFQHWEVRGRARPLADAGRHDPGRTRVREAWDTARLWYPRQREGGARNAARADATPV